MFAVDYHVDPHTPTPPLLLCAYRSAVCRAGVVIEALHCQCAPLYTNWQLRHYAGL